jgi:hypothetical protein
MKKFNKIKTKKIEGSRGKHLILLEKPLKNEISVIFIPKVRKVLNFE